MFLNLQEENFLTDLTSTSHPKITWQLLLGIVTFIALVVVCRYWSYMPTYFAADDYTNFMAYKNGLCSSSLLQSLGASCGGKYRPIFATVMFGLYSLFGNHTIAFNIINLLIQILNAILVFVITLNLSNGNKFISFMLAISVAASRFAFYQVTQTTGLIEGLSLTFFLVTLYCLLRADESEKSAFLWSWLALFATFLAIHTHERYIVILPWLLVSIVLLTEIRHLPRLQKTFLVLATTFIFLFNILYKKFILHIPFFIGTGGTHIGINLQNIKLQTAEAISSLFGFNYGPPYLAGINIGDIHGISGALPIILTISISLIIALAIWYTQKCKQLNEKKRYLFRWALLFFIAIIFLLGPPLFQIRLEQRWLFLPFILILLTFAWAAGILQHRYPKLLMGFAVVICLSSIMLDSIIVMSYDHDHSLYFFDQGWKSVH